MSKIQKLSDIQQEISFTEFDFIIGPKKVSSRIRATAMEGSFGTQKEHYGLKKIAARIKSTEVLLIFFGIHTANVIKFARRETFQITLSD